MPQYNITTWAEYLERFVDSTPAPGDVYDFSGTILPDAGAASYTPKNVAGTNTDRITIHGNGAKIGAKNDPILATLFGDMQYADVDNLAVYVSTTKNAAVSDTAADCTFTNVVANGGVESAHVYAGGLNGYSIRSAYTNCVNNAKVYAETANSGGIVGQSYINKFYACKNTGEITGILAAGIAGYGNGSDFHSCENGGNVIGSGNVANIGGIVGHEIASYANDTSITDNVNSGIVDGRGFPNAMAGGIVGQYETNYYAHSYLSNNINLCSVYSTLWAGGICGFVRSNVTVIDNDNLGDVFCGSAIDVTSAGGLIGRYTEGSSNSFIANNRVCAKRIENFGVDNNVGGLIGVRENEGNSNLPIINSKIENNYVSVGSISGDPSYTISIHQIVGTDNHADDNINALYGDNYFNAAIAFSPEPTNCDVLPKLCGTEYDPASHAPTNGDARNACMRAVWDASDCANTQTTAGATADALSSVVTGIASMENSLRSMLNATVCVLKNGIKNAEDVEDLTNVNEIVTDLIGSTASIEDSLRDKLVKVTGIMGDIIEQCDCDALGSGECCVALYFAADGTSVPAQHVQLQVTKDGETTPLPPEKTITDDTGKVYLHLEPNTTYNVDMQSDGEWEDQSFGITTDGECNTIIDGVVSECCDGSCIITTYRPGYAKSRCRAFRPFAPNCDASSCAPCKL